MRLAIVKEKEQRKKMREAFSSVDQAKEDHKPFEDKRITCFEQIYGTKTPIELNDIFEPNKDKKGVKANTNSKRLLVLGRAGIGKSTLCQYMAYQWANSNAEEKLWQKNGKEKFKLVLWIPLRNLLNYSLNEQFPYDAILKEIIPEDHVGEKVLTRGQIRAALKQFNPEEILYILDGYDEVLGRENELIRRLLSQANIILTSRPHGVNEYLVSDKAKSMDKTFENIGFLDEDIEHYIDNFFEKDEENRKYGEPLKKFLKGHPNIWGIAHIPINLLLICVAWKDNYDRINQKAIKNVTLTDLYYGLIVYLGRRYLEKQGVPSLKESTVQEILSHEKCLPVLAVLSRLAFEQMDKESLLILHQKLAKARLQKWYPEYTALRDDVIHFGVLTSTTTETHKESVEFYFVHLTFQEFLAAWHIAERLRVNDSAIKEYISRYKYSRRHEMVWWFVAGLLKKETDVLERFLDILESEPRDIAQLYHQMLVMRCMDECKLKVSLERRRTFFSKLEKLIEAESKRKGRRYFSFCKLNYLTQSQIVLSQPEIENKLVEDMKGNDAFKRERASSLCHSQQNLSTIIFETVKLGLQHSSHEKIADTINFFVAQKSLSESMLLKISQEVIKLFTNESVIIIAEAIFFFRETTILPALLPSVIEGILKLLPHSHSDVSDAAREFFIEKEFPEPFLNRVMEAMSKLFFDNLNLEISLNALKFFTHRMPKDPLLTHLVKAVVKLIKDPTIGKEDIFGHKEKKMREVVIEFFSKIKIPDILLDEIIEELKSCFVHSDWKVIERAYNFFAIYPYFSHSVLTLINKEMARSLMDIDWRIKTYAIDVLRYQKLFTRKVLLSYVRKISELLEDEVPQLRCRAVNFFEDERLLVEMSIYEGIVIKIRKLISDENEEVQWTAVNFFNNQEIPESMRTSREIVKEIRKLLGTPGRRFSRRVQEAARNFFLQNISSESVWEEARPIVAHYLTGKLSLDEEKYFAIELLTKHHLPSETEWTQRINDMKAWLVSSHYWDRKEAVEFIKKYNYWPRVIFVLLSNLLDESSPLLLEEISAILEGYDYSALSEWLSTINEVVMLPNILYMLIFKLINSHVPLYQTENNCLQIGWEKNAKIKFESQEHMKKFIQNFQKIFQEFTGLNLEEKVEKFSQAEALSNHGQFPASSMGAENEVEELDADEENKLCMIL